MIQRKRYDQGQRTESKKEEDQTKKRKMMKKRKGDQMMMKKRKGLGVLEAKGHVFRENG